MQLELKDQTVFILASHAYRAWSKAHDELKAVKKETNDGSLDWQQFHNTRLINAEKALLDTKAILEEIQQFVKLT